MSIHVYPRVTTWNPQTAKVGGPLPGWPGKVNGDLKILSNLQHRWTQVATMRMGLEAAPSRCRSHHLDTSGQVNVPKNETFHRSKVHFSGVHRVTAVTPKSNIGIASGKSRFGIGFASGEKSKTTLVRRQAWSSLRPIPSMDACIEKEPLFPGSLTLN